jgi:hypothetical protein
VSAVWPVSLPQTFMVEDFKEMPPADVVVTEMDTGPAKMRPRATAAPAPIDGIVFLDSRAKRATLYDFFVTTLASGTASFTWKHPVTGTAATYRFRQTRDDPGLEFEAIDPTHFRARMKLEILP